MNVRECRSEVSRHCKKINGTTVFYYFWHDVKTVLIKGLNAIHSLAEIVQRSMSKSCDSDNGKLNAEAHKCVPMKCRKRVEDADGRLKTNEGRVNPTKHVPIKYFYKNNNKSRKNNNVNNNRYNIFTDDTEIDVEEEEDAVKIIINEKHNNNGKEVKQEQEEKIKVLEVENETFGEIMRTLVTE